ncbi:MAG: purine-nucleoside phosphorylase [Rikenellaceae bacterium]|nr:purine-nucleoside phosphorylase [Rikenellaceae bacterium]
MYEQITNTACFIRNKIVAEPESGIILGTGLGGLARRIEAEVCLEYGEIPGFPLSTVEGHQGRLIFGRLGDKRVMAMQGRFHYYEGYTPQQVTFPVQVMKELGVKYLFVSNASGGVNPEFLRGDLMVITDHINLIPNPLIGPNMSRFGERFPNMAHPYDPELILLADKISEEMRMKLRYGCYVGVTGPSLETPKEYGYYRIIGGDTVGMSTTPEVIVGNHCGLRVFGISVITNVATDGPESTHELVQQEGALASTRLTGLLEEMLRRI